MVLPPGAFNNPSFFSVSLPLDYYVYFLFPSERFYILISLLSICASALALVVLNLVNKFTDYVNLVDNAIFCGVELKIVAPASELPLFVENIFQFYDIQLLNGYSFNYIYTDKYTILFPVMSKSPPE